MDVLQFRSVAGTFVLLAIAYALSTNRKAISWRIVAAGSILQLVFAFIVLKSPIGRDFFFWVNDLIVALLGFSKSGASFVFGNLVNNNVPVGTPFGGPDDLMSPIGAKTAMANVGAFFAFSVLPTIIFFSSLMAVLYYLGVMPLIVRAVSWIMEKTLRTSGAETLSAASNIFVGQTEAPLIVRPYLAKMTKSELFCVMTGGFATVAGGVMAAYVGFLLDKFPTIAGHLMAASVMSAPAAIVMAKIMYPEDSKPETAGGANVVIPKIDANVIDSATRGASEGMSLSINVAAMLIAYIALIALLDGLLGLVIPGMTLRVAFGHVFAPLAWVMGVPWKDCEMVGQLMGTKTVVNEFVAYLDMAGLIGKMDDRSAIIAIYALCGFSNFSSIGIQIGGISALAPERRGDLAKIGLRAMIAGSLACFMTATIAGSIQTDSAMLRTAPAEPTAAAAGGSATEVAPAATTAPAASASTAEPAAPTNPATPRVEPAEPNTAPSAATTPTTGAR